MKNKYNCQLKLIAILAVCMLAGCEDKKNEIAVTGIKLDKDYLELVVGNEETITATITPDTATDKTVIWTPSDPSIATATNGKVKALKLGETIITAVAGNFTATCNVEVRELSGEYELVWQDEFIGVNGKPDPAAWSYMHGFVGNAEPQMVTYQEDNVICKDGLLIFTAKHEQVPTPFFQSETAPWPLNQRYFNYTSSLIQTVGKKEWLYGRFEVRAKIPTAMGAWPAIWLIGGNMEAVGWASCGEIDIMEYYRINNVPHILANTAWGTNESGGAHWNMQTKPFSYFTGKDPDWANKFHIWRMDWDVDAIRIYLDDELLHETLLKDTFNGSVGNYTNPFRKPQYLLLNLSVGGMGGTPDDAAFPLVYEVDYVRVYQK